MATPTSQEIADAARSAIKARLDGGAVLAYTIQGRQVQLSPLSELMRVEDNFRREQAQEDGSGILLAQFGFAE